MNRSNEDIVKEIQQGTNIKSNYTELYEKNKKYIYSIVKRYVSNNCSVDELMNQAYFGLVNAVEHVDLKNYDCLFLTYAGYWIKQEVHRYASQNNPIKLSSNFVETRNKYNRFINEYKAKHGELPTNKTIAAYLGKSERYIVDLKKEITNTKHIASLDKPFSNDDVEELTLGDTLSSNEDIENDVMNTLYSSYLWRTLSLSLDENEYKLLSLRFKTELTYKQIAEKLAIDETAVKGQIVKTLQKIRINKQLLRKLKDKIDSVDAQAFRTSLSSFKHTNSSRTEIIAIKHMEIQEAIQGKLNTSNPQ